MYLYTLERECVWGGQREKDRGNFKQTPRWLWNPTQGLELTTLRSWPEPNPRVWHPNDCTTQAPLEPFNTLVGLSDSLALNKFESWLHYLLSASLWKRYLTILHPSFLIWKMRMIQYLPHKVFRTSKWINICKALSTVPSTQWVYSINVW